MTKRREALLLLCEDVGIIPGSMEDFSDEELTEETGSSEADITSAEDRIDAGEHPDLVFEGFF
jgi:hypothetical protein